MICTEYQKQLHNLLDNKSDAPLSDIMQEHNESCRRCYDYTTSMLSLHRELMRIPAVEPKADFIEKLKLLEITRKEKQLIFSWKPDVRRAALFISLAGLVLIAQWLPTNFTIFINFSILTIGLASFISTMLKPFFFERNGNTAG